MNRLESALRAIAAALDRAGRRWALVGGLAVSTRTEPRTTRDADVAVVVHDDADAEALVFSLGGEGFALLSTVEQRATGRPAARLRPPGELRPRGVGRSWTRRSSAWPERPPGLDSAP